MNYDNLFSAFDELLPSITSHEESWGYIRIKGFYSGAILTNFIAISECVVDSRVTATIDNENVTIDDIRVYISSNSTFESWELNINKLISDTNPVNYFYTADTLCKWLSGLPAFSPQNPFHLYSKFKIIVGDLDELIQGITFLIVPLSRMQEDAFLEKKAIPDKDSVNKNVHFITNDDIVISPTDFIFKTTSQLPIVGELRKLATISLAASIVSEFISTDKISLDGAKKMYLKLWNQSDDFSEALYMNLIELIEWVYEEKTATRLKLFYDRITLEIEDTKSYISGLSFHITPSLQQSKQRYNFLILERKDKYVSELKDLLKDIRGQSDLYSQKIRNLLNNLLRDILAAIVLVGFTLFTKLSDNIQLDKAALIDYVFYTLAIYYLVSIVLQVIIDITDIEVSKREMLYWKTTANELLPTSEVEMRINESLKGRRKSLRIVYPIIAIFYVVIAIVCSKFPTHFHEVVLNNKDTIQANPVIIKDSVPNIKDKKINDKISQRPIKTDSSPSRRQQGK